MYRTHFQTGFLFGLGVDTVAVLVGHPLPLATAVALPPACGYLSAIPDVDHRSSMIRHAVPPARWLYLLVQTVLGLTAGLPTVRRRWLIVPGLCWRPASQRRIDYWMDHRRITHTRDFPVWLGLAVLPLGMWADSWSWLPGSWWWLLGPATALGCWAHRAGDRLTKSGVPGWSWQMDRPCRGWRVRTGRDSLSERTFAVVQGAASAFLFWVLAGAPVPS